MTESEKQLLRHDAISLNAICSVPDHHKGAALKTLSKLENIHFGHLFRRRSIDSLLDILSLVNQDAQRFIFTANTYAGQSIPDKLRTAKSTADTRIEKLGRSKDADAVRERVEKLMLLKAQSSILTTYSLRQPRSARSQVAQAGLDLAEFAKSAASMEVIRDQEGFSANPFNFLTRLFEFGIVGAYSYLLEDGDYEIILDFPLTHNEESVLFPVFFNSSGKIDLKKTKIHDWSTTPAPFAIPLTRESLVA
ncbi:hypothetical protein M1349_05015 [Patescibacteria group bacterium]|nr:hypothetical protein [Patescibacteria group bacterium]